MVRFPLVYLIFLAFISLFWAGSLGFAQNLEPELNEIVVTEPFSIGGKVFRPDEIIIGVKDGQPIIDQNKLAEVQAAASEQVAAHLGIQTDSKFYPRINSAMGTGKSGSFSVASPVDIDHPQVVIKHLRSTAGIPLPGLEDLAPPKLPISEAQIKKSIEEYMASIQAQDPTAALKTEPLPDCAFAKTQKVTPEFEASDAAPPEFDFLFIAKGKEPLSPQELYGEFTTVLTYEPGTSGVEPLLAKEMGVSCLPTRFRFKGGSMFMHLGRDALRNYDRSSDGEDIGARKTPVKRANNKKRK